ncbi:hypothetical protein NGM37_05005, partial [Streptomyces sp. TRM76130]|nr:hypothetical protein [Streptomyces sp. TRM76130]
SGGGTWVRLGDFTFQAGGAGSITLSADAGEDVAADAVRLVHEGDVLDNDTTAYTPVAGAWNPATGVSGYYGLNYRTLPAG